MATTRNLHQIDEALQRPGRMDRIFNLQRPTQVEREKILQIAAKETMDGELIDFVDWKKVVSMTLSHWFLLLMCLLKLSLAFAYLWRHLLCYYYLINKMSSPNKLFSLLVVVIYMFSSVSRNLLLKALPSNATGTSFNSVGRNIAVFSATCRQRMLRGQELLPASFWNKKGWVAKIAKIKRVF